MHLHQTTFHELSTLIPLTQVDSQVTHIDAIKEVCLEVRIHVRTSMLSGLDALPNSLLTERLRLAIDNQESYVYVT